MNIDKLKQLRIDRKASLQDVADVIRLSKAHIWELEAGKVTNPGIQTIRKFAAFYNVSLGYLLDEDLSTVDEELVVICRNIQKLGKRDKKLLLGLMDLCKN